MRPLKTGKVCAVLEEVCHPKIRGYGRADTREKAIEQCLKSIRSSVVCEIEIEGDFKVPYEHMTKGLLPLEIPDGFLLIACTEMWFRARTRHPHHYYLAVPSDSGDLRDEISMAQRIGNLDVFDAKYTSVFDGRGYPFEEYRLPPGSLEFLRGKWILAPDVILATCYT